MRIGQKRQLFATRAVRLIALVQLVLAVIAVRYFWIQVAEGESYRQLADNNRLRRLTLEAPRGLIFDRYGRQLVENVPSYVLLLDRSLTRDLSASLAFAAEILEIPREELHRRVEAAGSGRFRQIRLAEDLRLAQVARFGVEQLEHPEFEIADEHQRFHRHAHHTAHVLGYVGRVTAEDLEPKASPYHPDDLRGRKGVEGRFEDHLRGRRGDQLVVVDSRGRLIEKLDPVPARSGRNLSLTLDLSLQQEAARLLEDRQGAVVALDPRQGDILALVSMPSFDPNAFARGLDRKAWEKLRLDPGKPLRNRALEPEPPGSVFKIIMALAGLDSGVVDETTRVYCRGATRIYGHRRRCWKASGHGWVNLETALRDSCDIYFYELGQKLGIEAIAKYSRMLGLGRRTGIEIRGEMAGLVPDVEWSETVRATPWYPGETISVAIGQGPILMTPLQTAVMMASLTQGRVVKPRLVLDVAPRLGAVLPLSDEHLATVRQALWSVVNDPDGTGKTARIDEVEVAGKTGTAQVIRQETWTKNEELPLKFRDHAWFAAYAPAEDPRLVVVVFVEHGGGGSTTAAPIARELFKHYFSRHPPPSPPSPGETPPRVARADSEVAG